MSQDSSTDRPIDPELLDLLIKRSTVGLEPGEQSDLDALGPDLFDESIRLDATAAAFDLAMLDQDDASDELPPSLRQKLDRDAAKFFKNTASESQADSAIDQAVQARTDSQEPTVERKRSSDHDQIGEPVTRREVIAMVIAAASLLLVFSGLNPLTFNPNANKTAQQEMSAFVSKRYDDMVDLEFKPVHLPTGGGKVVWSDKAQEGYMVLTGFPANDPSEKQYQLWIFDTDKAQQYPVDGGVFDISKSDVNAEGEVIVPIDAKISIDQAVQFAITVERPGGVVVSKRTEIPVLAAL